MAKHLTQLIHEHGPVPFHVFMETALYHPEGGFYSSGQTRTGRMGDFLTPVSPGPVLGQLLARQVNELFLAMGRPTNIRLVEQGADAGWLARDLVNALRRDYPAIASTAELHLVEPHGRLAHKQQETLSRAGIPARWHLSWETVPDDSRVSFFYSCELVDSFPVRIFRYQSGTWRELGVGIRADDWEWQDLPADAASLANIRHWSAPEVEGFVMELRPTVLDWVRAWSQKISRGLTLIMDYGFFSAELHHPTRFRGSLMALRSHQKSPNPLANPGQQDLTAQVNFTELEELAGRAGWKNYGLVEFSRGLTSLAAPLLKGNPKPADSWIRNFRHLTHPSFFGHTHKILVQGKSLPEEFQPAVISAF